MGFIVIEVKHVWERWTMRDLRGGWLAFGSLIYGWR